MLSVRNELELRGTEERKEEGRESVYMAGTQVSRNG